MKKIAFVNCWTMPGGVLNVVKDLLTKKLRQERGALQIVLFTMISEYEQLEILLPGSNGQKYQVKIVQAFPKWLNQLFLFFKKRTVPFFSSFFDYRNLIVVYPLIMKLLSRKIKKWKPDQVEISSFAIAKNIDPMK